ncbi:MAG: DEAD/DEAH box helicase [Gammaproteobacteria bacterium]
MSTEPQPAPSFGDFALRSELLEALAEVGYETPTAIQVETLPTLLAGRDVIGQAQTGTGKTAAFALPVLNGIDLAAPGPQALVLTPTRELAIQVAEAFQRYASHLRGFHVLPIYGGQDYGVQLRALRRGVHVVVGTPGRVMDHMRRATLSLATLHWLVLDEADEMLRMGFIDDIEWILGETPPERQTALFSATMPPPIRAIAERYLNDPAHISVRMQTTTAATIRQRWCAVRPAFKLDALTRILEGEPIEGVLVFVRTRTATLELAERLEARGFASAAINGDMPQKLREKTIGELRDGRLDVLVATDVAARGLDVERVSHVVNFDIPYDPEAYVHRIGRTGRAGRHGDAILLVTSREMRMLKLIERATGQAIERMELPSTDVINDKRLGRFMQSITETLAEADLEDYLDLVHRYQREHDVDPARIAAALARLVQGEEPLLLEGPPPPERGEGRGDRRGGRERWDDRGPRDDRGRRGERGHHGERGHDPRGGRREADDQAAALAARPRRASDGGPERFEPSHGEQPPRRFERAPDGRHPDRFDSKPGDRPPARFEHAGDSGRDRRFEDDRSHAPRPRHEPRGMNERHPGERPPRPFERERDGERAFDRAPPRDQRPQRPRRSSPGMDTYRIEVGHDHGVMPGNIVGAIAGETGLDAREIGHIDIRGDHSFVELPPGMPKEVFQVLRKTWVSGQQLRLSRAGEPPPPGASRDDGTRPLRRKPKERHRDKKNKGAPRKRGRD